MNKLILLLLLIVGNTHAVDSHAVDSHAVDSHAVDEEFVVSFARQQQLMNAGKVHYIIYEDRSWPISKSVVERFNLYAGQIVDKKLFNEIADYAIWMK